MKRYVTSIEKDSVFLVQYDVRQVPTNLGVYVLDTVAQYHFGINYKEIIGFGKKRKNLTGVLPAVRFLEVAVLINHSGLGHLDFCKTKYALLCEPTSCNRRCSACRHRIFADEITEIKQ